MRTCQLGILLALVALLADRAPARADFSQFYCPNPYTEIELGEFLHEFPTFINSSAGDSVDLIVNAVLPSGWFWQVCQVSSGICYFANTRIFVDSSFDPDVLRVDFFPNTNEPGVGYIQLEVRRVDDPTDRRFCTYTLYNGVPAVDANFSVDCSESTIYSESGVPIHELRAPITNVTALDDSVAIVPHTDLPAGWFFQFCQTSTGVCYFAPATVPLAAGLTDTIRVDFFPGGDGEGHIEMEFFSANNPSIFRRCGFTVFQGEDGFPASTPEILASPATVPSFAQPNPFAGETTIRLRLDAPVRGELAVYTAEGREVTRLRGLELGAGEAIVRWDGRDATGASAPAGVYFYRLEGAGTEAKGLMVKSH